MSRFTQRSTLAAAGLAGLLLAVSPVQAAAPRGGVACAPTVASLAGRPVCRVAHARRHLPRAYAPYALADIGGVVPVRFVSFLVLGVGY